MGRLVLMGSGETAPTMLRLHRRLLADVDGPAVVLDTPFGFQVNADDLVEKTVAYFDESVGRTVEVASWRSRDLPVLDQERTLAQLQRAGWAFAGPGSPSYALRQWEGTPVPEALAEVAVRGGTLCLGSAAAVVSGSHSVPVYEIYKAGAEPHWLDGLNLLGRLTGLSAAVVPHYDNNEGGHYDTRFCYLGEERLAKLERELPDDVAVLGIDEHTALVIDLEERTATVSGTGTVTARSRAGSTSLPDGTTVGLDELTALLHGDAAPSVDPTGAAASGRAGTGPSTDDNDGDEPMSLRAAASAARVAFDEAVAGRDTDGCVAATLGLEQTMRDWAWDMQVGDDDFARRALRSMVVDLGEVARTGMRDPRDVLAPFVDLAVKVRTDARERNDFATSDLVRDALAGAGVEVRDEPDGATWRLRDA